MRWNCHIKNTVDYKYLDYISDMCELGVEFMYALRVVGVGCILDSVQLILRQLNSR